MNRRGEESRVRAARGRFLARRRWRRLVLGLALGVAALGVACSQRDRPLNPMESYRYRFDAVRKHGAELSPEQRYRLMHHPGQTPREIDGALESYRAAFREDQARDAAELRESMARSSTSRGADPGDEGEASSVGEGSAGGGEGSGSDPEGDSPEGESRLDE